MAETRIKEFGLPHRTLTGPDAILECGREAARFGKRAFLGCGKSSMRRSGYLGKVEAVLKGAGLEVLVFDGIEANPSTATVDKGAAAARDFKAEVFIGLGGGSTLDATKFIALLRDNPGPAAEYLTGERQPAAAGHPVIAIPSTSGTGSEANHIAVITNERSGIKKGTRSPDMVPRVTILDAKLCATMPGGLTAHTGLDALAHAIESFVSTGATPLSRALSMKAIGLIGPNLPAAVERPDDLDARHAMALAAYMAGASLMAGVGLCHELAMAIGSCKKEHHGELVARLIEPCLAVSRDYCADDIVAIARALGPGETVGTADRVLDCIDKYIARFVPRRSLSEVYDLSADDVPEILRISRLSTNITTNPRPLNDELRSALLERLIERSRR